MATPALVAGSATTRDNTTAGSTAAVNMPGTVNAGEILEAYVLIPSASVTFSSTPPTGWELVSQQLGTGSFVVRVAIYRKIADGTEDGTTVSFALSGGSATSLTGSYRLSSTALLGAVGTWADSGSGTTVTVPAITVVAESLLLMHGAEDTGSAATVTYTPSAGWTQFFKVQAGSTVGGNIVVFHKTQAAAGSTGTSTMAAGVNNVLGLHHSYHFDTEPPPVPGAPTTSIVLIGD